MTAKAITNDSERGLVAAPETAPAPVTVKDAILQAATNPNIDPDRLERFLGMYERLAAKEAEQAYDVAMNGAQEEMRPIAKDLENEQTRSRYASFAALDRAMRPIYAKHGFSLSFSAGEGAPEGCVRVVCRVSHRDGHKEFPHIDMPADGKGARGGDVMSKTHATGAAFTYAQRYLLRAVFNIAVSDDDDGNDAFPGDWINEKQVDDLIALIDEVKADRTRFLNYFKIDTLARLPAKRFDEAVRALEKKRAK